MPTLRELVDDFLEQKRIAVAGVSRSGQSAANAVYQKLRASGYHAFAVNPNAETVEGDRCYRDLASIPDGVGAAVIATHPSVAAEVVEQCARCGVRRVWLHRSFGTGSVTPEAIEACRRHGIRVIAGGCPMMFCEPVDFGHKCMRWVLAATGGLPRGS